MTISTTLVVRFFRLSLLPLLVAFAISSGYCSNGKKVNEHIDGPPIDSDTDGLPDHMETSFIGLDPTIVSGTDPNNPDTDSDGILDGTEDLNRNGRTDYVDANMNGLYDKGEQLLETSPLRPDTDRDGLNDGVEDKNKNGQYDAALGETDATSPDTDLDGLFDGIEDKNANGIYDVPNDDTPEKARETDPRNPDTDGDCQQCAALESCRYLDGMEDSNQNGRVDMGETDPTRTDSDNDGITDTIEDVNCNGIVDANESSPKLDDSDDDYLPDGMEDKNHDGHWDSTTDSTGSMAETSAYLADSDGDMLKDGEEDFNHDGIVGMTETDPKNPDTDGDCIDDGREVLGCVNSNPSNPLMASIDEDNDSLPNCCEKYFQDNFFEDPPVTGPTDPCNKDTDGDGIDDGQEDANQNCRVDVGETDPRVTD